MTSVLYTEHQLSLLEQMCHLWQKQIFLRPVKCRVWPKFSNIFWRCYTWTVRAGGASSPAPYPVISTHDFCHALLPRLGRGRGGCAYVARRDRRPWQYVHSCSILTRVGYNAVCINLYLKWCVIISVCSWRMHDVCVCQLYFIYNCVWQCKFLFYC